MLEQLTQSLADTVQTNPWLAPLAALTEPTVAAKVLGLILLLVSLAMTFRLGQSLASRCCGRKAADLRENPLEQGIGVQRSLDAFGDLRGCLQRCPLSKSEPEGELALGEIRDQVGPQTRQ